MNSRKILKVKFTRLGDYLYKGREGVREVKDDSQISGVSNQKDDWAIY